MTTSDEQYRTAAERMLKGAGLDTFAETPTRVVRCEDEDAPAARGAWVTVEVWVDEPAPALVGSLSGV